MLDFKRLHKLKEYGLEGSQAKGERVMFARNKLK